MKRYVIAFLALQACAAQGISPAMEPDAEAFPEFAHQDPTGVGMPLTTSKNKSAPIIANAPMVTIGQGWPARDMADVNALIATSVSIMAEPQWLDYGRTLKADYPKAWLAAPLRYGDAERVTAMAGRADPPIGYVPATVVPFGGWAVTRVRRGRVQIAVNPTLLQRWRSKDVVMRSCAVNTMAHEITHTLSLGAARYSPAFTDTGVGNEARQTPPASYLAGNIALCGNLIREGRIQPDGLKSCVAIWYRPAGFQSQKCDAFPGNASVE